MKGVRLPLPAPKYFMPTIPQLTPGGARYQARRLVERARALTMRGDRFHCPCCDGKWRTMLPAGIARRPNARCPRCGSLERHRLIWTYLQQQTDFFTIPYRVLDVAPEEFMQRQLRSLPNITYLSIDLESGLAMRKMDVTKLDLADQSFDIIFCNHVFEHIPDDRAAMRELYRVLQPGGWAILQTPVDLQRPTTDEDPSIRDPQERLRRFGQTDHIRIYGLDFFDRLRQSGWQIERNRFVTTLSSTETQRRGLDPREELFIGRKPV